MKQAELVLEPKSPKTLTVTEVVRAAGRALEARFAEIWIEGEVSNFKRHSSGHMYFSLKDAQSQLPCVMFRMEAARLKFLPEDGLLVRCRGRLSIYEQQGKFQLYVQAMEPSGLGAMQLAFEQLRRKLAAEGLFDAERKRPLPRVPRVVGVVTSPTGAAVRDVIRVLHRRAAVRIIVSPCVVQGEGAPASIVRALALLVEQGGVDVVILGRGGGSSEDLFAFNDEQVVRAVAACPLPVISAVGHEVDVTLCDFVADVRAPTPSGAAELAVPVHEELRTELATLLLRLRRRAGRALGEAESVLERLAAKLDRRRVTLDRRQGFDELAARLRACHPRERLVRRRAAFESLHARLQRHMQGRLEKRRLALETRMGKLDALSPLRVLERGYAIATTTAGSAIRDSSAVADGDTVDVRLSRGTLACVVKSRLPG